jgi:hypothetical protein
MISHKCSFLDQPLNRSYVCGLLNNQVQLWFPNKNLNLGTFYVTYIIQLVSQLFENAITNSE